MSLSLEDTGGRGFRVPFTWPRHLRLESIRQFRLFLILFCGISGVLFVLWQVSLYVDGVLDNRQRRVATREVVQRAGDLLRERMTTFAADLRIIASDPNVLKLASGNPDFRNAVIRRFRIFEREKPVVAQLRYLDKSGQEVVRVDRLGDRVITVPDSALQDKSNRYYFKQSISLPVDGLFLSAIDLNVEHGAVEVPWKPMLRLAVPIPGPAGDNAGVVIVNVAVAKLLKDIESMSPSHEAPLQILNPQGYWIAGAPREQLWGFMFGRDTTMAKAEPGPWKRIAADIDNAFEENGTYYAFHTLRPATALYRENGIEHFVARDTGWKILGTVPPVTLGGLWKPDHLPLALIGLLVIAGVSLGWSRAMIAHREAEDTKQKAEAELVRVERLASLGSLVAGVAHELNTPIGNAVTVASTLSDHTARFGADVEAGQVRRSALDSFLTDMKQGTAILLRGLQRAAELVGHFKQIAVDQTSEQRRHFLLEELVQDVIGTTRSQFKQDNVTLEANITSTGSLDGFPGPLGQVLINLTANARLHGFDAGMEGKVVIAARDLPDGDVEITVEDTGKGIPDKVVGRIFEPFFTTRLGQEGTGLGLSIVFNIVTGVLGGTIDVESTVGTGTRMIVRIPRTAPEKASDYSESAYDVDR